MKPVASVAAAAAKPIRPNTHHLAADSGPPPSSLGNPLERAWILIGMMGSGKSTVGRLLAQRSGRDFIDTDQLIVRRLGRPIHQLFSVYGQDTFRDHESSILKGLEPSSAVIATGGGTVLREANWLEFQRLGTTVYLQLEPELLIERLEKSSRRRPLLEVENWPDRLREILEERRALYERADLTLKIESEDLGAAAERLFKMLGGA